MKERVAVAYVIISICFVIVYPLHCEEPHQANILIDESLKIGEMERTFSAYIPSGELSSPELIIALHGSMGTGKQMQEMSAYQFDRLADQKKCIVIYPDGYKKNWNDCRKVPKDDAHTKNIDDVRFIAKLIEMCCSKWHVNPKKVYAVGFSNGGHMCFRLAIEIPDKLTGIAVIGASMPAPEVSKCSPAHKNVAVMIVNGTADPINPFDGGMVRLFFVFSKGEVISSTESAKAWLKTEELGGQLISEQLEDRDPSDQTRIERLSWPSSKVCLYIVHNGGHTIPGGKQYLPMFLVGRVSRDINMAEEAWRFFHLKP